MVQTRLQIQNDPNYVYDVLSDNFKGYTEYAKQDLDASAAVYARHRGERTNRFLNDNIVPAGTEWDDVDAPNASGTEDWYAVSDKARCCGKTARVQRALSRYPRCEDIETKRKNCAPFCGSLCFSNGAVLALDSFFMSQNLLHCVLFVESVNVLVCRPVIRSRDLLSRGRANLVFVVCDVAYHWPVSHDQSDFVAVPALDAKSFRQHTVYQGVEGVVEFGGWISSAGVLWKEGFGASQSFVSDVASSSRAPWSIGEDLGTLAVRVGLTLRKRLRFYLTHPGGVGEKIVTFAPVSIPVVLHLFYIAMEKDEVLLEKSSGEIYINLQTTGDMRCALRRLMFANERFRFFSPQPPPLRGKVEMSFCSPIYVRYERAAMKLYFWIAYHYFDEGDDR